MGMRGGSPVPDPASVSAGFFEIAGDSLGEDLGLRPQRHIFTHVKSAWFSITDDLPQLDAAQLAQLRRDTA